MNFLFCLSLTLAVSQPTQIAPPQELRAAFLSTSQAAPPASVAPRARVAINCPATEDAMKALMQTENAASSCIALNPCTYSAFTPCSDPRYNAEFRTKYVCLNGTWNLFGGDTPYNACPTAGQPYFECMGGEEGLFQREIFSGGPHACTAINSCVFNESSTCSSGPNPSDLRSRRYLCVDGELIIGETSLITCGTLPVLPCPSAEGDMQALIAGTGSVADVITNIMNGVAYVPCSVAAQCIYGSTLYTCEGAWRILGLPGPAALLAKTERVAQHAPRKIDAALLDKPERVAQHAPRKIDEALLDKTERVAQHAPLKIHALKRRVMGKLSLA